MNTNRIDYIDELASSVNDARCHLRATLQWNSDDADAVLDALHKFENASAAITEYAESILSASLKEVK